MLHCIWFLVSFVDVWYIENKSKVEFFSKIHLYCKKKKKRKNWLRAKKKDNWNIIKLTNRWTLTNQSSCKSYQPWVIYNQLQFINFSRFGELVRNETYFEMNFPLAEIKLILVNLDISRATRHRFILERQSETRNSPSTGWTLITNPIFLHDPIHISKQARSKNRCEKH